MRMNYPSVKAIKVAFGHALKRGDATRIRRIMIGPRLVDSLTRLERIDRILGTYGVEVIPRGHNGRSPAIAYCNAGDTYTVTILKVNGHFRIGTWGDLVERGNYD
jgi:hypothetical protein